MSLYLDVDFSTSGARAIALAPDAQIQAQTSLSFDSLRAGLAERWQTALFDLLE